LGWRRPSSGELDRLVRSRKANTFLFQRRGIIPNHPAGLWSPIVACTTAYGVRSGRKAGDNLTEAQAAYPDFETVETIASFLHRCLGEASGRLN